MGKGKVKLAAVLAVLILAGGLFPLAGRITATQQQKTEDAPDKNIQGQGGQKTEDDFPSLVLSKPSSEISGREFFYKMVLSVLLVAALGVGAIYLSKKLLPRFTNLPGKQIRVLETAYLAPRKGIHLVQVGGRRLLVASTNETITMLADVTPACGTGRESEADFAAELEKRS